MYGHLVLQEKMCGWRPVLSGETLRGMPLLRIDVPVSAGLSEKRRRRRIRRAAEQLWERGINRVLVSAEFPHAYWESLGQAGLIGIDTVSLCQEAAPALTLRLFEQKGKNPAKGTVCLLGNQATGAMQHTAECLAKHVSRIMIDAPQRGGALAAYLQSAFGMPYVETGSVKPDLTVAFSPERGGRDADLKLYGPVPDLAGFTLCIKDYTVPEEFAPLPAMSVLRECGYLQADEVRVSAY